MPTTGNGAAGRRALDLAERVRDNQQRMAATVARLGAVATAIDRRRRITVRLRQEARQSLARLSERRAEGHGPGGAARPTPGCRFRLGGRKEKRAGLDARRQAWHETYTSSGDPAIRAALMASYDGSARSLARRYRDRDAIDDLVQVARIGLLHAIDRYDPTLGRPFPLFARITITGELKRHLRDKTWALRVPRSLQEDYLTVMRAADELMAEHSASPTIEALADHSGLPPDRVVEGMKVRVNRRAVSIDLPVTPGSDERLVDHFGEDDIGFGAFENRELLRRLLGRLPERDRRMIELRFIHEMTQAEIAAETGLTQMCVSRALDRILGRLRVWARDA